MIEQAEHQCPVCALPTTDVDYDSAQDYITGETFQVYGCGKCGLSFTHPIPESFDRFYPQRYRRYSPLILSVLSSLYRRRVSRWNCMFKSPGTALEFGCGDGIMLSELRRLGWTVCGTERTEDMAKAGREKGLEIFVAGSSPIPEGRRFDLIVLFQVLEHLPNPLEKLKECKQLLAPGGRIVVGVPNFASWQSRFTREGWFHLDVPRHVNHFSPDSLSAAAEQAGLALEKLSFESIEHDPYGWVQSTLNKLGNGNRLTKLLMRLTPPTLADAGWFFLAGVIGLVSLPVSLLSWRTGSGAIMEGVLRER